MLKRDTDAIINYRLCAAELNATIYQIANQHDTDLAQCLSYQTFLQSNKNPLLINKHEKKIFIFPMCKDSETDDNQPDLKFIGEVLTEFYQSYQKKDAILLLPMRMCRGFFKMDIRIPHVQRKHAVLVIIDLASMHIQVCDSQGWNRQIIYPDDKFQKLALGEELFQYNHKVDYHAYNVQEDAVSCGYYVLTYIEKFLQTRSINQFDKIILHVQDQYPDKWTFLKKYNVDITSSPQVIKPKKLNIHHYEDKQGFVFLGSPVKKLRSETPASIVAFDIDEDSLQVEGVTHSPHRHKNA